MESELKCYNSNSSTGEFVVVLGWGGSKIKQLQRVIKWYTDEKQIHVVAYIDTMVKFVNPQKAEAAQREVHTKIREYIDRGGGPNKFVTHLFSNNGSGVLARLIEFDKTSPDNAKVITHCTGIVWDSAPKINKEEIQPTFANGWMGAKELSRPLIAIYLNKPVYEHWLLTPLVACLLFVCMLFGSKKMIEGQRIIRENTHNHLPHVPMLFVYSEKDMLIESDWVDRFIEHVKQHVTKDVSTLRLQNTGHVLHFRDEPELVKAKIDELLQRVLPRSS